ncbi:MAG: hypothetical protein IH849_11230 [Acidobacteria bacterium]|nr:hypothetical protein [Acidobacteriota bacterium]
MMTRTPSVSLCGLLCAVLLIAGAATAGPQNGSAPLWYGQDGEPLPFVSHDEALSFLRQAAVLESEEIEGSQNRPLRMVLEKDGVRARAIFRRVYETWQREWIRGRWHLYLIDRAISERAAYVVARMLGFDNIPPTVLRELDGKRGTLQLWLEGMETQSELIERRAEMSPGWADQMAGIWVFDNLLFNADRHPGNLLIDRVGRVWMIDHTQAFQYDERLIDIDQLRRIPRPMWERLREISEAEFEEALADSLNDQQLGAFFKRRRRLVELIEGLIAELGEARVLLEGPLARSRNPMRNPG